MPRRTRTTALWAALECGGRSRPGFRASSWASRRPSHPRTPASETVTLVAFDEYGGTGVKTATFNVSETPSWSAPVVTQWSSRPRLHPRPDRSPMSPAMGPGRQPSSTATAPGPSTLALERQQTFTLSHTFANAGTFLTTVTVTNARRASGTASFTVDRQRLHRQRRQPAGFDGQEPDLRLRVSDPGRAGRLRAAPRWQAQP